MAEIHTLKKDGKTIYPQTHIQAVVDDNGNTVAELISQTSEGILSEVQAIANGLVTKEAHTSDINRLEAAIPNKTSQLINDSGYATTDDIQAAIQESIINEINSDL